MGQQKKVEELMRDKLQKYRRMESIIFLLAVVVAVGFMGFSMGFQNFFSTIMKTAHELLLNTVFYIMAVTVLTGALAKLLMEFGVVQLLELLLSPFMRPLFRLPGVASLGGIMTFLSDNPAVVVLASDKNFSCFFSKKELISFINFSTAFGMGLIVVTFMVGKGFYLPTCVGVLGAFFGGWLATRLSQIWNASADTEEGGSGEACENLIKTMHDNSSLTLTSQDFLRKNFFQRFLNALLDGGKSGVDLGLSIIPGVLVISTCVMLLTFGPADPALGYQGKAFEGVPVLPWIAEKFNFVFTFLFGFTSPESISFPVTALGSVGAAMSLVPTFLHRGFIGANDIAVFTAMGMCYSGFLSTYSGIFDTLKLRKFTTKAIAAQIFGGLGAGVFAHYLFLLCTKIL